MNDPSLQEQGASGGEWFIRDEQWSRAGLSLALMLLLMGAMVRRRLGSAAFLVYLQLPVYMLHQYEEHGHGAFKREVNSGRLPLPGGRELTDWTIFWVNIPGVWGVDTCLLYLTCSRDPTIGLAAPYLAVINGVLHIGYAVRWRRYNPGLWTSLLLFLPFGSYSASAISRTSGATRRAHVRGVAIAVFAHLVTILFIVASARRRAAHE